MSSPISSPSSSALSSSDSSSPEIRHSKKPMIKRSVSDINLHVSSSRPSFVPRLTVLSGIKSYQNLQPVISSDKVAAQSLIECPLCFTCVKESRLRADWKQIDTPETSPILKADNDIPATEEQEARNIKKLTRNIYRRANMAPYQPYKTYPWYEKVWHSIKGTIWKVINVLKRVFCGGNDR